jgi:apolipoprotein N-acyltransferase
MGAGLLLAASLPPWGWWPLAFCGIALLDHLLAGRSWRGRFWRGALVAAGLLLPSLSWIASFTVPGYAIAVALHAAMFGAGCAACPGSAPGRWLALPGAWMLVELVRGRWPFGGVPVARLAMGQVDAPIVSVARIGGSLLLDLATVAVGVVVAIAVARRWRIAAAAAAAIAIVVVAGAVAPRGHDSAPIRIAVVQGGGPQGTRFDEDNSTEVFRRHLDASASIPAGSVDVVLWPENVVNIEGSVTNSDEGAQLSALAQRLHATVLVGVVEGDGDRFHNAQVAIDPNGDFVDRYEKVRRVPFGEFVPLRSLLEPIAGNQLIARDAADGQDPPVLQTPAGRFGVVISWEVFFPDRARAAIRSGGEILLNPTNGASFHGSIVQSEQLASSRLRAIETGRWVVQAAPTGFSAVIAPSGRILQRTGISEQRVLEATVPRRAGDTIATRAGDWPAVALAALLVVGGWFVARRSEFEEERDGPVVDERDAHVGTEDAGGDRGTEGAEVVDDDGDERLGVLGPSGTDPRGSPPS